MNDYHVAEVVVFNRQDCCSERLDNVNVQLFNANNELMVGVQHEKDIDPPITDKFVADFERFDLLDRTRKVRISVQWPEGSCNVLNFADVQVMAVCQPGDACMLAEPNCEHRNVAQCKKATQSTTRNGLTAIKATDGDETMATTECENNPWW